MELIEIPFFQQQECIWWFIPIIAYSALAGGAAGLLVGWLCGEFDDIPGKSLAILGMQGSGKTQLLSNIRNVEYKDYAATLGEEAYEPFTIHLGNRDVKIEGGKDIGGGEELIKDYYEEMIKNNEIIFFLFNAYEYRHNSDYQDMTQARLDYIHRKGVSNGKTVAVFGTFADKFKNEEDVKRAYSDIKQSVANKTYAGLLNKNFGLLNMRNQKQVMEILDKKIFARNE